MESGPSCDIPDLESLRRNLAQSLSANQGASASAATLEIFQMWHTLSTNMVVMCSFIFTIWNKTFALKVCSQTRLVMDSQTFVFKMLCSSDIFPWQEI